MLLAAAEVPRLLLGVESLPFVRPSVGASVCCLVGLPAGSVRPSVCASVTPELSASLFSTQQLGGN